MSENDFSPFYKGWLQKEFSIAEKLIPNFVRALSTVKSKRKINYDKIVNRIQLKRIQNSTTLIEGFIENLQYLHEELLKLKYKKQMPFSEYDKLFGELLEGVAKNLFESIALILNIIENQTPKARKEWQDTTKKIKRDFSELEKLCHPLSSTVSIPHGCERILEGTDNMLSKIQELVSE
jgi:hypothetical protein